MFCDLDEPILVVRIAPRPTSPCLSCSSNCCGVQPGVSWDLVAYPCLFVVSALNCGTQKFEQRQTNIFCDKLCAADLLHLPTAAAAAVLLNNRLWGLLDMSPPTDSSAHYCCCT